MLAGRPRLPSRFWSMKTTRAAKAACKPTGMIIAPWMAPLMKRSARGHLGFISAHIKVRIRNGGFPTSSASVVLSVQKV